MLVTMRITVTIADELLVAARVRALDTGGSLDSIIEAAFRHELAAHVDAPVAGPTLPVFTRGTRPQPGVELDSNRALREFLDEHRNLDSLR